MGTIRVAHPFLAFASLLGGGLALGVPGGARADGILIGPASLAFAGLWERKQEAIILADAETLPGRMLEELVLKLTVESAEDLKAFSWIVPLPAVPEVSEAPGAFDDVRGYVEERRLERPRAFEKDGRGDAPATERSSGSEASPVSVLSRKTAGSYEVAIVRARDEGALDAWLAKEGFRTLEGDRRAKEVVDLYRKKGYVFACVKVRAEVPKGRPVELPPLRFTFETGGRDGVYFPMKMTGLQEQPFDLDLHVASRRKLDETTERFGYAARGLEGRSSEALGATRHLTSLAARGIEPAALKAWPDDLWVFPESGERGFVPFDARPGGPAAAWAAAPAGKASKPAEAPSDRGELDIPLRHVEAKDGSSR